MTKTSNESPTHPPPDHPSGSMSTSIDHHDKNDNNEKPHPHHHYHLHHSDPFAPREGKTLTWKNVNMILQAASNNNNNNNTKAAGVDPNDNNNNDTTDPATPRKLLDNVWGEVPAKQTTALMGPSGAGKTSLLNILAGRARSHGRVSITSDVRLNNYAVDPTDLEVRKGIAFVAQDDSLQVTSTPREAIRFSATLRLPRDTPTQHIETLVERMLSELGLTACADTIVGGALIKGISGGERKRTSVGVELVVKPAMVFLDEPTSGLDSFSAVQVCQVLKKVANAGSSVLFTIHQPSSEIFDSFDHLILLNKGRVMYQGAVSNVPHFFGERGHSIPPNYNPADWIMTVAQANAVTQLDQEGFFPEDERNMGDAFEPEDGKDALGITITGHDAAGSNDKKETPSFDSSSTPGFQTQTYMLFAREFNNLRRDTTALGARFGLTIFLSLLVGTIFWDVGASDLGDRTNLNSSFGAIIQVMLMSMFGTAQPALLSFPAERPVFLREYSTDHYSVASYFMSRLTMEALVTGAQVMVLCIMTYWMISFQMEFRYFFLVLYSLAMSSTAMAVMLGCAVEDPKIAQEMLPILFVPQMLFAGFFVAPDLIPSWLRWARYLCSLTYSVRIALVEEFEDCAPDGTSAAENCARILDDTDADPEETYWNWLVLLGLFVFFRLLALYILRKKATKFF